MTFMIYNVEIERFVVM